MRSVRNNLKQKGIENGVLCLYSNESTERKLVDMNEDQARNPEEYRPLEKMRVRTIPVLGTMPALFGYSLASATLCQLAKDPLR